jgi:hypothetical protein
MATGNPNTARTPASTAGPAKADQRTSAGSAKSGSTTGPPCRWASTQGPSPNVYCNSSIRALTSLDVHTDPCGRKPAINMMPAPLISVTSAHTTHSRDVAPLPSASLSRARMRSTRSSGITDHRHGRPSISRPRSGSSQPLHTRGGARRGPDRRISQKGPSSCRASSGAERSGGLV